MTTATPLEAGTIYEDKGFMNNLSAASSSKQPASDKRRNEKSDDEQSAPTITPHSAYPESIFSDTNEKWMFVVIVGISACLSTLSIPIYFPTLDLLAREFNVSVSKINITATVYSIFQGVSPIFWATLSDTWGRRPVYFCCAIVYLVANICLARAKTYGQLLGLRILQAFGGASTVSLVGGTIGDFSTRKTRGGLIGVGMGISQLGNCFGPLIGSGVESQFNSWRAVFWALVIFAALVFLLIFFLLPETNRHIVGNGSRAPLPNIQYLMSRSLYVQIRRKLKGLPLSRKDPGYEKEWILPQRNIPWFRWTELFFQGRVLLILIPTALHYTNWYMVLTAQSTLLSRKYNFSTRNIGMTYLASGIGTFGTSVVTGKLMQFAYKHEAKYSPINIYKARLGYSFYASAFEVIATIVFGWCMHFEVSFYAPVVMTFVVSAGAAFYLSTTAAILVDLFPGDSAASQSCNNLARCLLCAGGIAAVQSMMDSMTIGGCFTFTAALCVASSICIWFVILKYGPKRKNQVLMREPNEMIKAIAEDEKKVDDEKKGEEECVTAK